MKSKKFTEFISERVNEGFLGDVFSGKNIKYSGLKGYIKGLIDAAREKKEDKEREKSYNKFDEAVENMYKIKIKLNIGDIVFGKESVTWKTESK